MKIDLREVSNRRTPSCLPQMKIDLGEETHRRTSTRLPQMKIDEPYPI
jgi:hypothetical protein